jgi:archaellum component FlaC
MLEDIKRNIERLIALYEAEKVENGKLRARLSEKEAALATCKEQITGLEGQVETLKLSQAFIAGGNSTSDAKEKIDRMIKEIDRCISLLEKS